MKKSCLHLDQLLTAKFLKKILQTNGQEKSTQVFTQNIKVKFVFSWSQFFAELEIFIEFETY